MINKIMYPGTEEGRQYLAQNILSPEETLKRVEYIMENDIATKYKINIDNISKIILECFFPDNNILIIDGDVFGLIEKIDEEQLNELIKVIKNKSEGEYKNLYNLFLDKYRINTKYYAKNL